MTPRLRQLALTAHVTTSVGWIFGAIAAVVLVLFVVLHLVGGGGPGRHM